MPKNTTNWLRPGLYSCSSCRLQHILGFNCYLLRHFDTKSLIKRYVPEQICLKTVTFYRIVDEWNSFPLEVRLACSADMFKSNVIKFVNKIANMLQIYRFNVWWNITRILALIIIFIITLYEVICFHMGSRNHLQIILMAFYDFFLFFLYLYIITIIWCTGSVCRRNL